MVATRRFLETIYHYWIASPYFYLGPYLCLVSPDLISFELERFLMKKPLMKKLKMEV